jgi:tRNA (guanine-N7-)-methyltransferase
MAAKALISFNEIASSHPLFSNLDIAPDWDQIFSNNYPMKLEIGFGNGSFIIDMAMREPRTNFIGLDMYHKGIRKTITRAEKRLIENIHIVYGDARNRTQSAFQNETLEAIYINFPDPWPKKRHIKRRLITASFVETLSNKLVSSGELRIATDCETYARDMLTFLENSSLENKAGSFKFSECRENIPQTKYEKNYLEQGKKIFYLDYIKR